MTPWMPLSWTLLGGTRDSIVEILIPVSVSSSILVVVVVSIAVDGRDRKVMGDVGDAIMDGRESGGGAAGLGTGSDDGVGSPRMV